MNKKKGFTIVELIAVIGILALIAGIFAVNMVRTLNKNRDTEESSVITRIKSAADSYVSMNPDKLEDLHNGFNFVDIPIEVLRNAGLLSEDLKDPKTGEIIPDKDIVRVELNRDKEDSIKITYPVDKDTQDNTESWILIAKNITINSEANSNWCAEHQYDDLELKNNKGDTYTESLTDKPELKAVCNVDPSKAGEYTITYTFKDMATGRIKTVERKVTVLSSTRDVVSFDVVIIGNIKNGKEILQNSDLNEVKFQITEKYRDGTPNIFEVTISDASEYEYSITGVTNDTPGTRSATVTRIVSNSDGSIPTSRNPKYTVRKNTYTLTLDPKGGSVSPSTATVTVNKKYGEAFINGVLPTPRRNYYTFNGWFTKTTGGEKIINSAIFSLLEDQTLYAQWSRNRCTIFYEGNGGTVSGGFSDTIDCGESISSFKSVSRSGYTFNGWFTSSSGGTQLITPYKLEKDITTYAHWTKKSSGGGSSGGSNIERECYMESECPADECAWLMNCNSVSDNSCWYCAIGTYDETHGWPCCVN